jgi:flagellin
MGLVINHNLMAMNTARNLSIAYGRLAISTQRLSSGLRVNSGADDAAGLAVRETMRADIAVINQGVRNAGDAISMIQTADGALSVVDEKLIRMKELAEQAATGTYSTAQRAIMDGEYQAMAAEIDRIANATNFNGVKLLDGSLSTLHASGMKIHFGTGNSSAEDYYYISMDDMRATASTGLQVGGGATAEILAATTDFTSGGVVIASGAAGQYFAYTYDVSGVTSGDTTLSDFAGFYYLASGTTLDGMVDLLNQGTAARTYMDLTLTSGIMSGQLALSGTYLTVGNLQVWFMSATLLTASVTGWNGANAVGIDLANITDSTSGNVIASAIVDAINGTTKGNMWAVVGSGTELTSGHTIMLVYKDAGVGGNGATVATGTFLTATFSSTQLSGGGATWAIAAVATQTDGAKYLQLTGNDKGANYDITIQSAATLSSGNLTALGWGDAQGDFSETEATGSGSWAGADILTQSTAQEAMAQIATAINSKDSQRATLGAMQNRFQNTITNLQIQAENTQAAESRISDVDVATEMTNFTRNSILTQAATAMLAQANAMSRLALQLLGGGGGGI